MPTPPTRSHGRLAISANAQPRELMSDSPRLKGAWCARVVTLFPELFPGVLGASLTGKALQQGLWALDAIDLRVFGTGKHRQVDDTPAGGGAGLVMKPDVLLSGNHGEIAKWRRAQSERLTQERRPDLWAAHLAAKGD